jgi:uncharacterized protein (DUF4415 family)
MSDELTGKALTTEPKTDWDCLRHMSDAEIHASVKSDPDIMSTDEDFWENAKVVLPQRKPTVTIRLDADVLAWLKDQGKGYQTSINAILRAYMKAHKGGLSNNHKPQNG